jgi:hypothetical protein
LRASTPGFPTRTLYPLSASLTLWAGDGRCRTLFSTQPPQTPESLRPNESLDALSANRPPHALDTLGTPLPNLPAYAFRPWRAA